MKTLRWLCVAVMTLGVAQRAAAHEEPVAAQMAEAAQRFASTLTVEQRPAALVAWGDDQRQGWYFVPDKFIKPPGKRSGLPIGKMSPQQRVLAYALLNTALSHGGFRQATTIMALERVLHEMENNNPIRDSELYYVTLFGTPSTDKTWSWRVEGHHLSINVTLVGGQHIAVTPSFFGSNPGRVPKGAWEGLRILADEEDLARKLVKSLTEEQRKKAVLTATAPEDVITTQDRKVNKGAFFPPQGVAHKELNEEQRALLLHIVGTFAHKYRGEVLHEINERTKIADTDTMFFAWAGGLEPGDGHYFRVQTARFLFEYDNTQNNANHVHAVWRDFDGDFGEDLLKKHYEESHKGK